MVSALIALHHPFDPPAEYLDRFKSQDMPLPSTHPSEPSAKTSFQRLDRIWAHNNPGEFHTEAMTDEDRRQVCAAYLAMVALIDDQISRILSALEETNRRKILWSSLCPIMEDAWDQGSTSGPHFYDCQLRVR